MKTLKKTIRSSDLFTVPIDLRYKSKSVYQTIPGGLCSLFILALLSFFAYSELHKVADRNFQFVETTKYNVPGEDLDVFTLD